MLLQQEVSNYHNKLQPGSQGPLCTDYLSATIKFCLMSLLLA